MDSARYATAAGLMHDRLLRQVWGPPPLKRDRPAPHHQRRPNLEIESLSTETLDNAPSSSVQRVLA